MEWFPMEDIDKFICTKGVKASTILSMIKGRFNYNDDLFCITDDEIISKKIVDSMN